MWQSYVYYGRKPYSVDNGWIFAEVYEYTVLSVYYNILPNKKHKAWYHNGIQNKLRKFKFEFKKKKLFWVKRTRKLLLNVLNVQCVSKFIKYYLIACLMIWILNIYCVCIKNSMFLYYMGNFIGIYQYINQLTRT